MSSSSTNSGFSQITITFDVTRDPDIAAVDVQNRVNQAIGRLPAEVRQLGVTVQKVGHEFHLGGRALFAEGGVRRAVRIELPRRLHQGRAEACAGRGRHRGLRRAQVLDARLAGSGAAGRAPAHGGRRRQRPARAERERRRRQRGRLAGTRRADLSNQRARGGAPDRSQRVREHHRPDRSGRDARPPQGHRDGGAGRRDLLDAASIPGRGRDGIRHPGTADGQCARRAARRIGRDRAVEGVVPAGTAGEHRLRHDHRGAGVDQGGHRDAAARRRPGRAGDVRVPPELAGHAHSDPDDAGVAHWRTGVRQPARLLDQYAHAVCDRPGDRHRRGRRDRGD